MFFLASCARNVPFPHVQHPRPWTNSPHRSFLCKCSRRSHLSHSFTHVPTNSMHTSSFHNLDALGSCNRSRFLLSWCRLPYSSVLRDRCCSTPFNSQCIGVFCFSDRYVFCVRQTLREQCTEHEARDKQVTCLTRSKALPFLTEASRNIPE